jgi:outer membrane protein OmpA-like peptidoglycan-associated protein
LAPQRSVPRVSGWTFIRWSVDHFGWSGTCEVAEIGMRCLSAIVLGAMVCAASLASVSSSIAADAGPIPRLNITSRTGELPGQRRFTVFFERNSANLSSAAQDLVARIVDTINQSGMRSVTLTGHTDTLGSRFYNLRLSQRRADAVNKLLIQKGISKLATQVYWRGEFDLLVPTQDGVNEFRNRRVEIVVE